MRETTRETPVSYDLEKDGGPAFPRHYGTSFSADRETSNWHGGMSLRDYFAGQALAGFCAHLKHDGDDGPIWNPEGVVLGCYTLADAMLKARIK